VPDPCWVIPPPNGLGPVGGGVCQGGGSFAQGVVHAGAAARCPRPLRGTGTSLSLPPQARPPQRPDRPPDPDHDSNPDPPPGPRHRVPLGGGASATKVASEDMYLDRAGELHLRQAPSTGGIFILEDYSAENLFKNNFFSVFPQISIFILYISQFYFYPTLYRPSPPIASPSDPKGASPSPLRPPRPAVGAAADGPVAGPCRLSTRPRHRGAQALRVGGGG